MVRPDTHHRRHKRGEQRGPGHRRDREADREQHGRQDRATTDPVHAADHADHERQRDQPAGERWLVVGSPGSSAPEDQPRPEREQHAGDHHEERLRLVEHEHPQHGADHDARQRPEEQDPRQRRPQLAGPPEAHERTRGRDDVVDQVRRRDSRAGYVEEAHLHRQEEHRAGHPGGRGDRRDHERDQRADPLHPVPSVSAVRKAGLEPARSCEHWDLNPARLPVTPLPPCRTPGPRARPSRRRQRPSSWRSFATWPFALTAYIARSILPSASITNVERITPMTVLP